VSSGTLNLAQPITNTVSLIVVNTQTDWLAVYCSG